MPLFGQVVIGPPGAGKSTYCHAMQQFLNAFPRPCACINLDPANDQLPYDCAVDICELVNIDDVMTHTHLGPNGGLLFCMDYIETKLDWLRERLAQLERANSRTYLIIDMPGQVELLTHHTAVRRMLAVMVNEWHVRLVCVHLVDRFVRAKRAHMRKLQYALCRSVQILIGTDYITVDDDQFGNAHGERVVEGRLVGASATVAARRVLHRRNGSVVRAARTADIVNSYSMVQFTLLNVHDKKSMLAVLRLCDQANGYVFAETDAPHITNAQSEITSNHDTDSSV